MFRAFLRLGVTSFGGPVAHLGFFRDDLVARRRWVDERTYGELVALGQFLPGPASSQVGFALGLGRAGSRGALAAWVAFTLPSALLMVAFAYGAAAVQTTVGAGVVTGLKVVAVAVVAHAVQGMARTLTPDARRASIAVAAALLVLLVPGPVAQVSAIVLGALAGLLWCRSDDASPPPSLGITVSRRTGALALALFTGLLVALPLAAGLTGSRLLDVADGVYRAGALVFGGGHVVLPLLQAEAVGGGWVSAEQFLAGYGAAQALPGPLFAFAAYLGALALPGAAGLLGALVALVAVFLPGFLVLVGVLPFWAAVRTRPAAQSGLRGANAAVVGVLAAALYDPVFVTAVTDGATFGLALLCFVLLTAWRTPPWGVVLVGAAGGVLLGVL
ncbi:chromate efflux transporter [Isoptericola jiangsuensis]|uniref:chromate efflux transporter n=1 Tax=Isoptericola jiangsuensis TaxID=548579 RepID=UPI003AAAE2CD